MEEKNYQNEIEDRYNQMTIDQLKEKLNNQTLELLNIHGVFEVHLIVDPNDQMKLFAFTLEEDTLAENLYSLKPTCALSFYGHHPNQPMLTFFLNNCNSLDAVKKSVEIADKLKMYGMTVHRLKVEAMAKDVPEMKLGYNSGLNYFEFHFKVDIKSKQEWDKLAAVCLPFGAHLFFNPYSKSKTSSRMIPVVTLRRYDCDLETANDECNNLIKKIEDSNFLIVDGKIQRELSIIDTNVFFDQDWLFKNDPRIFTTD
jgi:hypothetical protein